MGLPNILWILTTQWRGQALGCAGDANARTPHFDRLAAGGRWYTRAYTPHPFGPFARAAILTGVPSPANGIRDYFDALPRNAATVAHRYGALGYRTAFIGKWHLSSRDPLAPLVGDTHARQIVAPADRGGFSFWEGFESGFQLNDPWLHGGEHPEPRPYPGYQSDVLTARAARWIAQATSASASAPPSPWFCVLSLEPPHPPYHAPASGIPPRDPASLTLPPNVPRGGEIERRARHDLAGYYAHVEATDRAIGRLIAALDLGSTRYAITSVHGDLHGSHGLFRKGWPHEESVRVPLLIGGAGIPPAREADPVSLLHLPALTDLRAPPAGPIALSMPSVVALPDQCDRIWHGEVTATTKRIFTADGAPWTIAEENAAGSPRRHPSA